MRRWSRAIIGAAESRTSFSAWKNAYFGVKFGVFAFNTAVLFGSTIALLGFLHWILRRQLEVRRS